LSLSAMLIYIWIRFEWQFSLGAIIALVHDVIITIGFFSIFFDRRRRISRRLLFVTMCGAHVLSFRAGGLGLAVVISRVDSIH